MTAASGERTGRELEDRSSLGPGTHSCNERLADLRPVPLGSPALAYFERKSREPRVRSREDRECSGRNCRGGDDGERRKRSGARSGHAVEYIVERKKPHGRQPAQPAV